MILASAVVNCQFGIPVGIFFTAGREKAPKEAKPKVDIKAKAVKGKKEKAAPAKEAPGKPAKEKKGFFGKKR